MRIRGQEREKSKVKVIEVEVEVLRNSEKAIDTREI